MIEHESASPPLARRGRGRNTPLAASWGPPPTPEEQESVRVLLDILEQGRITTVFQPIFDLRSAEVFAYEALSRVVGPSRFSGPGDLFRTARSHGLTSRLEALCIRRALSRARELGITDRLSLNVSPSLFRAAELDREFSPLLEGLRGMREHLVLELAAPLFSAHPEDPRPVADLYRRHGFRIAIDDLGSGFAELQMLADLEPYLVKIDLRLFNDLHNSPKRRLLLETVTGFCHKINAHVVAERVETPEELLDVCSMGVDLGQGFYLARPNRDPAGCNPQARAQILSLQQRPPSEGALDSNRIGALARFVEPVDAGSTTEAVIERFQNEKTAKAIPILDGNRPVGIIHETKLFSRLGQRFGYSLFSRKQVSSIMEPVLVFDAGVALEEVSREVLNREESRVYDSVVVVQQGVYSGIVTMQQLYERITDQKILLAAQANPLTGLPGNHMIKQEISRRLENQELFAVIYADLDHFKPFNDHHGFARGDSVIRFLGDLLARCTREWDHKSFLGHVGGDDFVIACRAPGVEGLCRSILDRFDHEVRAFHDLETVQRGYYESRDRRGIHRRFPLLSLSLAVLSTETRVIVSYGQLTSIASEIKKEAKAMPGSSFFIDRRHE